MTKKLFTKIKTTGTAKRASHLKKRRKEVDHLRMAQNVYTARIEAQKEADVLRRTAAGTADKPHSLLD